MNRILFETQEEFEDRKTYNELKKMVHKECQSETCVLCKGVHKTDKNNQIITLLVDGKPPRFVHEMCLGILKTIIDVQKELYLKYKEATSLGFGC